MREIVKRNVRSRLLFFVSVMLIPLFAVFTCIIYKTPEIPYYEGETVTLTGVVISKDQSAEGTLSALYIDGDMDFKCYVSSLGLGIYDISIGDSIQVKGRVKFFRRATNPGEFDMRKFYETRGYLFYLEVSSIQKIHQSFFPVNEWFFRLKTCFCNIVDNNFPIEHGTVNTLLFGNKNNLDDDRKSLYKTAGVSHFLVISGLHISVAGGGIYMLLRRFGVKRSLAAFFGILFVVFYGCVVGFTVSVMRAVVMYLIRLFADILKRSYDILTSLAVSCIITLFINPLWIRDSSFLYSYMAVLFVGLYMTYLRKKLESKYYTVLYERHGFKYTMAKIKLTIAPLIILYLGLLPINLYFQSYSNILSVPLNLLLGFLTTPVIFTAALGFLFGILHLSIPAGFCDFICGILLRIIDIMSTIVSNIRITQIIYKPSLVSVYIYYFFFVLFVFIIPDYLKAKVKVCIMSTLVAIISVNFSPYMYLTSLDVEQGDCMVARTGIHSAIISDCGSSGRSGISENVVAPYLLSQGFTTIEDIYVSHGDTDHVNGIVWLLDNQKESHITINRIVFPKLSKDSWNENFQAIKEAADRNGVKTVAISSGATISYGKVKVSCLSPDSNSLSNDSNTDSLVLWLQNGNFDALLTGDATETTENSLPLPKGVSFELLKVSHHGSRFSSTENFLNKVSPLISTISVGASNNYGHPHPDTLSRLSNINSAVYRTDTDGAITIIPKNTGIQVKKYISE